VWVNIYWWDEYYSGIMEAVVKVDEKGRIVIPKEIREKLGIKEKQVMKLRVIDDKIVLEPLSSIADEYYGVFEVKHWPEDLDTFLQEAIKSWWKRST